MADHQPENEAGAPQPGTGPVADTFTRPFSLYEALPFSPVTSVVPFHPGVIPTPTLGSGFPASDITESVPRHDYDMLNQDASQPSVPSRRLEQALEHTKRALSPKRVTTLTFRKGPEVSPNVPSSQGIASNLSPYAKMVYENANVARRYLTPPDSLPTPAGVGKAPSPSVSKKRSPAVSKSEPQMTKKSPHPPASRKLHGQNEKLEISIPLSRLPQAKTATPPSIPTPNETGGSAPSLPSPREAIPHPPQSITPARSTSCGTKEDTPVSQSAAAPQQPQAGQGLFTVDIPDKAKADRDEYLDLKDAIFEPTTLSQRRLSSGEREGSQDVYGLDLDQRQKSDAAFQELRRHLCDIFVAEESFPKQPAARQLIQVTSDGTPTITTQAQQKTYVLIDKAIDLRCFADAPVDDLLRVQKLSEGALKHADGLDTKLEQSWEDSEVQTWVAQLSEVDNGLRAARTSMKIMSGGREDRQLYSEDTIQLAVGLFKNTVDGIIVPVTELRHSGPTEKLFKLLAPHKKAIASIFTSCQRLYSLMASLIRITDLSDTVVGTLEFLSTHLIFVENAPSERESVLGTQKFDGLRLVAMDMLSQIFLMNPRQRQGIFDDILTSLEKLPVGKQSARQFKLADGKSIQPVSALLMRLVQASSSNIDDTRTRDRQKVMASLEVDEDDDGDQGPSRDRSGSMTSSTITSEDEAAVKHAMALRELKEIESSLMETARLNATFVNNFLVNRALNSTKAGGDGGPFRILLDMFVEDLTTCLDSPDWPGAEFLLRVLMVLMMKLVDGERTAAPAKNMALELLGSMGAAISKLRSQVRKTGNLLLDTVEPDDLSSFLTELAAHALERKAQPEQMLAWQGPFRAVLEHLGERLKDDPHLTSAVSLTVALWANRISVADETFEDQEAERDAERDREFGRLAYRLRMMILDRAWLSNEYKFKAVSPQQARASYAIVLVQSPLCEAFPNIVHALLRSMASDQATVRSKSLKSINQVIDTDPSILDGESHVVQLILRSSSDSSTQVRDSALGLIGKCIALRPVLELKMLPTVLQRFIDSGVGVRKRAMRLAKDIYLRNHDKALRGTIAAHLLHRVSDPDEGVRDLMRQMVEETWIFPFSDVDPSSATDRVSLHDHVALMVQTVKQVKGVANFLDMVLQAVLAPESKTARPAFEACRKMVASMFDIVDRPDSAEGAGPSGKDVLEVLKIFAKADAGLFTFEQLRLLRPHVVSITSGTTDAKAMSLSSIIISRHVIKQLSGQHHDQFLLDMQKALMPTVSSVGRTVLDEVVALLRVISDKLGSVQKLVFLTVSSLCGMERIRAHVSKEADKARMFLRYALIVGMVGKHCDLDGHIDLFKERLPRRQGDSTSKIMVDVLVPFAKQSMPTEIRKSALDAVGLVCQSSPRNFVSPNVYSVFQEAFATQNPLLEEKVLRSLKEFLLTEERRSEQAHEAAALNGTPAGKGKGKGKESSAAGAGGEAGSAAERVVSRKELTVMGGTNYDDVASATTQRFLKDLTRIATSFIAAPPGTKDDGNGTKEDPNGHAFLAAEVLASINRQGLVHPKETFLTMMTLETCPVRRISELALQEHRLLHEKHESTLEREYAKALHAVFQYQRDQVEDSRGAIKDPASSLFIAKLHLMMEVLKISKSKNRQRFLQKMCSLIDFDPAKLELEPVPAHVEFSRFLIENLAFMDYQTVGELQLAITSMERLVTGTGASVAHAIESEIFQVRMDDDGQSAPAHPVADGLPAPATGQEAPSSQAFFAPPVDQQRLRQLTAGSMILSALWEARTFLRRLYGVKVERRSGEGAKAKPPAKDLGKPPVKVQNVTGDKVWEDIEAIMSSLSSHESMMEQCRSFVELLNVDKEFKIADEDAAAAEEDAMMMNGDGGPSTPSGDEDDPMAVDSGRGRKRKASGTPAGGRKKRARSGSQPRKRGRPRKNPLPDEDAMDDDGDWR